MKFKLCIPALLLPIAFASSCTDRVYGPAMRLADIVYMPKPIAADTARSANYISAGLTVGGGSHYSDDLTSGQLNFSRANSLRHLNIAYGAFGAFGNYHNNELTSTAPHYFTDKFYGAAGGRVSANYYFSHKHFDFRVIGFEAAYSHEFGSYANFRKALNGQPGYYVDPRVDVFSAGATSEIIFHSKPYYQYGLRLFVGGVAGNTNNLYNQAPHYHIDLNIHDLQNGPVFINLAYFMQLKSFFTIVEISTYAQVRVGYRF